jgi:putative redox protein
MNNSAENSVTITESDVNRPYAQIVTAGRHVLSADEPKSVGGRDTGPSPYEYLLAGLGSCATITMRMYARRHQWPLRRATVEVWHEKVEGPDGRSMTDRFHRVIHLDGDLTGEQRQRLLDVADKCPVSRTLGRASLVGSELAGTACHTPSVELCEAVLRALIRPSRTRPR